MYLEEIKKAFINWLDLTDKAPESYFETISADIQVLSTCFKEEFIEKWLKDMREHPPAAYPLTLLYDERFNIWLDFYIQTGGGYKSLSLSVLPYLKADAIDEVRKIKGLEITMPLCMDLDGWKVPLMSSSFNLLANPKRPTFLHHPID